MQHTDHSGEWPFWLGVAIIAAVIVWQLLGLNPVDPATCTPTATYLPACG